MPRKKSPVTPPGIDPGTFRIVAQCLNYYATPDPSIKCISILHFKCILVNIFYTINSAGIAQSVQRLATAWTVRGSNPGEGEIFRTHPDRPWGPPSLQYNVYRVSFPGVKRPGRGADHPPSSNTDVKERVKLYVESPLA
jgi:hypothetical protein